MLSSLLLLVFFSSTAQLPPSQAPIAAPNGLETPEPPPVPKTAVTDETRGDIYMARKMYREAIDKYEQMPETAVLDNKIGIAYHQLLQLKVARKYYQRAVKLKPTYAEAMNNIGTAYYGARSYGKAIKIYKRALQHAPNSASIFSNLGTAYFARHDYKRAFDAYQTAMSLDPDVFEHRNAYGVLLQERNVDDLARFHFYMAKAYAKSNMPDRALLYMRKALEEGFKDRERFIRDPEFASLQKLPEFQQLLALQPRVL